MEKSLSGVPPPPQLWSSRQSETGFIWLEAAAVQRQIVATAVLNLGHIRLSLSVNFPPDSDPSFRDPCTLQLNCCLPDRFPCLAPPAKSCFHPGDYLESLTWKFSAGCSLLLARWDSTCLPTLHLWSVLASWDPTSRLQSAPGTQTWES